MLSLPKVTLPSDSKEKPMVDEGTTPKSHMDFKP